MLDGGTLATTANLNGARDMWRHGWHATLTCDYDFEGGSAAIARAFGYR